MDTVKKKKFNKKTYFQEKNYFYTLFNIVFINGTVVMSRLHFSREKCILKKTK